MEEIELHIIKNDIITIGDRLIDSDDIFHLCKRIVKSRTNQCVDTILECIFYMPVKIGIYITILGILTKNNEKLKLQVLLKLSHNIEVYIKDNPLHCLLWFRCIIGLSCCHVFDFAYCLNLFKNLYNLCIELYKEKKFIKGDNILYLFLSNFFYISKQIYDENKSELENILINSFDLIEKRQEHIDNIDIDNNDISTIEYIYIYTYSIIHSDNFNDRLFHLKGALYNYVENNLKSVATHRFYQKEIFQKIFLEKDNIEEEDISTNYANESQESKENHVNDKEGNEHIMNGPNDTTNKNSVDNYVKNGKDENLKVVSENTHKKEINLQIAIEKCVNAEFFVNYECAECIGSLQIKFKTKHADNKNVHDVWLMQEHILHIIELYKNSVEFSSKILGVYVQLQSKLYNNVLIECIFNKLLSSFSKKNYYFYISLVHRLLLINKNLGTVIIRCIKFVLKQIGKLDNESFYLFMELCLYMLSYFSYENKMLKSKENFFKRKYNDMNKIIKIQEGNMQKVGNDARLNGKEVPQEKEAVREEEALQEEKVITEEGPLSGNKRKRKRDEIVQEELQTEEQSNERAAIEENSFGNLTNMKRNQVILKKNEDTLNKMKSLDCKIPFCVEVDVKYSSDESNEECNEEKGNKKRERNNHEESEDEKDDDDDEEEEEEEENNNNDDNDVDNKGINSNKKDFDFVSFKEELAKLDMGDNLRKFTNLMYNVKKKYCRKWTRNFYFKSCSLVYKNESENLIPKSVINYCNSFKCINDNTHDNFHEFFIFNAILKYCTVEINNVEDEYGDMINEDDEKNKKIDCINKFRDAINVLIQCFMYYLNEKNYLNKVPYFFENVSKNIHLLNDISSTNLNGAFFNNYIFKNDFLENSECWNRYSILILFFKALIFFDSSNVSSLKKVFKNHAIIFSNYKNSGIYQSEDDKYNYDIELVNIVYTHFNNSVLLNVIVNILVENEIIDEFSVIYFIFNKLDESNLDEYYVFRLIYEVIDSQITKKEYNDLEKNRLKRKQTKNENEVLIKELEDKKNELVQKIFHLTNKTIVMLGKKMMKLKNEHNSYMSKELLKESLVFLRTYMDYIDIDQFLQSCHENNFASELLELATIFKYASLKKK
ncbi:hypothetical protein MKS88_003506 [Plasmodium brasilianum]|uniref:Uncharacterized protein n=1 Tax=Plasmodium brasilianum TaxID=5824 RepID=A0ACB9Y7N2_PLABR|nr:hypothetical protein MKS88_003506 [Plasmodium brasilianum]